MKLRYKAALIGLSSLIVIVILQSLNNVAVEKTQESEIATKSQAGLELIMNAGNQ